MGFPEFSECSWRDADGTACGTIQATDAWGHTTAVDEGDGMTVVHGYSGLTGFAWNLAATEAVRRLAGILRMDTGLVLPDPAIRLQ